MFEDDDDVLGTVRLLARTNELLTSNKMEKRQGSPEFAENSKKYLLNFLNIATNHIISNHARSQDSSKGGSHCVKVRVLTRLSCRPPRRVFY